jgi:hypothetical protein
MTEDRMQYELNMWFSELFPDVQERLFMVQNTTYTERHGVRMKAMGLKKSVPDMLLIAENCILGIELKAPESKHPKEKIESQYKYGAMLISCGHYFIMSSNLDDIKFLVLLIMHKEFKQAEKVQFREMGRIESKLRISGRVVKF